MRMGAPGERRHAAANRSMEDCNVNFDKAARAAFLDGREQGLRVPPEEEITSRAAA
jgi:hypothetical protein